jgi:hypothetical protein
VHPDSARELKVRILEHLPTAAAATAVATDRPWPRVAVGLSTAGNGRARVAVRLQRAADLTLLPDLGRAARAAVDLRVIGRVRPFSSGTLSSPAPATLQRRCRPLRPGLSVAHPSVTAGTLGGFVQVPGGLAIVSNSHVLAASGAATAGDAVLQPGPADGGAVGDRVGSLAAFQPFRSGVPNLVDAAVALLDEGTEVDPGALPGGPLAGPVPMSPELDPDDQVEKLGRTSAHTLGRISAVEVDAVAVDYDGTVHRFDDQLEIEGLTGAFSAGGDSGSVIWRSRDRAPVALLFAGSSAGGRSGGGVTFANPLATVLATLGAEWISGPGG